MNRRYQLAIRTLRTAITQATVSETISRVSHPESTADLRASWYLHSYPVFLGVFSQTSNRSDIEAWVLFPILDGHEDRAAGAVHFFKVCSGRYEPRRQFAVFTVLLIFAPSKMALQRSTRATFLGFGL